MTATDPQATGTPGKKPFRWGFASALGLVLLILVAGGAAGFVLEDFGLRRVQAPAGAGAYLSSLRAKDWLFLAFLLSTAFFLFLQRAAVARFFRTMHVGVTLVALSCIAVAVGVLVPQIDGFEDPTERVPSVSDVPDATISACVAVPAEQRREVLRSRGLGPDQVARAHVYIENYRAFRWAEGYFLYHLLHLYGIGMPEVPFPRQVEERLERYGERYGVEERDNRRKQMTAAFTGQEKTKEIRGFVERHDTALRRAFDVCTALHLNRAYKSSWFATLLGLLGVAVFFNTFRFGVEKALSIKKVGFFTVHLGVMTILAGGAWSKLKSDRGILHMDLRDAPKDVYWAHGSQEKPTRMPFALDLERFARQDFPTLEVGFFGDDFRSTLPEFTLWPGRKVELDFARDASGESRPRIRLEVRELAARASVGEPRFSDAPDRADPKGLGALAELAVTTTHSPSDGHGHDGPQDVVQTALLKPDYPSSNALYDPAWSFRLRSSYGPDPEAARRELLAPASDVLGRLVVRATAAGEVEATAIPFRLGQRIEVAGFSIEVQEATADFRLDPNTKAEIRDPRPLGEQFPRNPGVWVSITPSAASGPAGPAGTGTPERRPVLEGIDWEAHGGQDRFTYKDLVLKLEWERWASQGPPRYLLHWGPDGGALLLAEDGTSTPVEAAPASASAPALPLPGASRVALRRLIHNALFEKRIELLAPHVEGPGFDDDFYSADPVGLEVLVTSDPGTSQERQETVRLATSEQSLANLWSSPDERFWLRFYENSAAFPFEWRSVLAVWQKDADGRLYKVDVGLEKEREIRVNDYFHYRGYRFFQTNADARFPTYSGIGVVYDPGIPVVIMGMYLTIVGAILVFLVRPIVEGLDRSRRRGTGSEAAA